MKQPLHLISLFSLLFFSTKGVMADSNSKNPLFDGRVSLFASAGPGITHIKTYKSTSSTTISFNIPSYILYKFEEIPLGLGIGAFAEYVPKVDKMTLKPNNTEISGGGSYSSTSFGPRIQYFFKALQIPDKTLSISIGYLITSQTYKIKEKDSSNNAPNKILGQKIVYEGSGQFVSLSLYDHNKENKMFPWFLELTFMSLKGKKQTVVGGTKFEVKPLLEEDHSIPVKEYSLIFTYGLKLI